MKKNNRILKKITVPSKHLLLPIIYIYANDKIIIEQVDELISFSNEKIELLSKRNYVAIHGNKLVIELMYPGEMIIRGQLHSVNFHPSK